nr:AzoC [Aspergillus insulicola]
MVYIIIITLGLCAVYFVLSSSGKTDKKTLPLPPGPKPLPVLGNLFQIPKERYWERYQELHRKYGPIFSLNMGTKVVIVLGNHQVANDLLEKRSRIYSSRPAFTFARECLTKNLMVGILPYGPKWRESRRVQASLLTVTAAQKYEALQDLESKQLLFELLSQKDFSTRIQRYTSSLIYTLAYGERLHTLETDNIDKLHTHIGNISVALEPGKWLVDVIPILNYLPRALAKWKRVGDVLHKTELSLYSESLARGRGKGYWNWAKETTTDENQKLSWNELCYAIGEMYGAGSFTTATILETFVKSMVLHPGAQTKAQHEIDSVVGSSRLPTFGDSKALPYVNAIVSEVLRWRPLAPSGLPHCVTEDDEYEGYRIPKGATIIANQWSLDMDEAVFGDPASFRPERWIENPGLPSTTFGYGRRVCVGHHVARRSLFLAISRILWTFNITPAYKNGKRIEVDPANYLPKGPTVAPYPFDVTFEIRSPMHKRMVEESWNLAEKREEVILEQIGKGLKSQ